MPMHSVFLLCYIYHIEVQSEWLLSLLSSVFALPYTDLNLLPVSLHPKEYSNLFPKKNLAVLPCHRNGNIRSGVSDLPSRQKKRNALQRYKNTVRTGKGETIWKYILKKG